MKNRILGICSMLLALSMSAQAQKYLPKQYLELNTQYSRHGSGDLEGVFVNTDYTKFLKKNWNYSVGLGYSIHDGSAPLFYTDTDGMIHDGSYRYTTAGVQLQGMLGRNIIRTKHHHASVSLGALTRYQSSSASTGWGMYTLPPSDFPYPFYILRNHTPQRTVSVGALVKVAYAYALSPKVSIGITGSFQTDTNGDSIQQLGLLVRRNFY